MSEANHAGVSGAAGERALGLWHAGLGRFLLLYFLLNLGMGVFPPLLPQIMGGLNLSFAQAGLLGTAFGLTRFVVDLPIGLLVERLGFPLILHAGMTLFVLGTVLAAGAPSFGAMALARGLTGLGSGAMNIVSILYLMHTGPVGQRNRRSNLYELAVIAGMAVSSDLAGMIGGRWGWRWSFWSATLPFAAAWAVAAMMLPALAGVDPHRAPSNSVEERGGGGSARKALVAIYVAMFTQAFAWGGGISTLLPLYGGSGLGFSSETIGRAMALAFWVEVCLLFPVGWAADAWGKVRILVPGFAAILLAMLVTDLGFIPAPATVGWLIGRYGFLAAAGAIAAVVALSILLSLRFLGAKRPIGRAGDRGSRGESEGAA